MPDGTDEARIRANLARVRENIAVAARRAGRAPESVRLVVVTKLAPAEAVAAALGAGVTDVGENRVQEGMAKRQELEATWPELGPATRWHLIGHLQTNKAAKAVAFFDLLHSIDSLRVAEAVAARPDPPPILLQVNVAGEETKFGVSPEAAVDLARSISRLPGLEVRGLMTMAPLVADPEEARPLFRRLAALAREIEALRLPKVTMEFLSMGMSQDYEVAVSEGANLVRVGTAVFGPRGG